MKSCDNSEEEKAQITRIKNYSRYLMHILDRSESAKVTKRDLRRFLKLYLKLGWKEINNVINNIYCTNELNYHRSVGAGLLNLTLHKNTVNLCNEFELNFIWHHYARVSVRSFFFNKNYNVCSTDNLWYQKATYTWRFFKKQYKHHRK